MHLPSEDLEGAKAKIKTEDLKDHRVTAISTQNNFNQSKDKSNASGCGLIFSPTLVINQLSPSNKDQSILPF